MQPLLSIIIPTKNRYNCLFPVLDTLVKNIVGDDYEIIVQDNTEDNSEAVKYFQTHKNDCVKYFHVAQSLDIVSNCTNAITNSCGKYLIMIGDDDFISPYVMQIVKMVDKLGLDNLTYTPGNYYWPQTKFAKTNHFQAPSVMTLNSRISTQMVERDSQYELDRVLAKGGCFYLDLPRFYHGILSRKALESVKERFHGKTYFPGPSPDMAISMALTTVLDKFHYMNYPVSVTGVSATSTAGMGVTNTHVGRIEDQHFLPKETIERWNPKLPRIWTAFTIYGQSIHQVLEDAGIDNKVDYTVTYAFIRVFEWYTYKEYLKPILEKYFAENPKEKSRYNRLVAYLHIRKCLMKPVERFKGWRAGAYRVTNMQTADQVMQYLKGNTKPRP